MEIKGQEAKKKGGAIVWMDPPFLGLFIGGWFRVAPNRSHPMHQRNSAQAGNVVGNRLDFLVVQLG
ncbi:MAG TPA: hypothetical protein PK805_09685, partial [Acidovorax temperans]|nr:hypothetical protein [Acidovorax temperans]